MHTNFQRENAFRHIYICCSTHNTHDNPVTFSPSLNATAMMSDDNSLLEDAAILMDNNSAAYGVMQFHFTSALWSLEMARTVMLLRSVKRRSSVRVYIKSRSLHYFRKVWPNLDKDQFKSMFRFDRDGFHLLVGAMESQMLTEPPPGVRNIVNR